MRWSPRRFGAAALERATSFLGCTNSWLTLPMMFTILFGSATVFLTKSAVIDHISAREFATHRQTLAAEGGGVLFVLHPADCVSASLEIAWIADALRSESIPVLGAILRDDVTSTEMTALLDGANKDFPHVAIHRLAVARLAELFGHKRTPLALLVAETGRIVAVEPALEHQRLVADYSNRLKGK